MASGARPGSLVPPRNGTGHPSLGASDNPQIQRCLVAVHYNPIVATVFGLYIIAGLLYTFAGYRFFKTTMFLTGFIFASSLVYLICLQGDLLPTYGNAGVAALAGVLFGLITTLVQYVGLFISGLHTGLLLGFAGLLAADYIMVTSPKGSVWLCIGVLLGCALMVAIFNLYFRKGLTVIGCSLYGGAILSTTIDYFLENLSMISWVWQRVSLRPVQSPPCWFSWIVLGSWPLFFVTGIIIQGCVTGRGRHHEDDRMSDGRIRLSGHQYKKRKLEKGAKHQKQSGALDSFLKNVIGFSHCCWSKKPRAPTSMKGMTKMDRAEMRQKKYRYLYQVRTAHGDVISQNFVQQMQKKDSSDPGGECSTLQSDATHLTILPDNQLVILTESEDDTSQTEMATKRR